MRARHCQNSSICNLKGQKVLNEKMHSGDQTAWPQAFETLPTLIFLKRAMSQCGLLKDVSERERVQGKWAPKAKKNTKCLENYPQGSLTKQRRRLQGKGFFIENKKRNADTAEEARTSTDCGRRNGKC